MATILLTAGHNHLYVNILYKHCKNILHLTVPTLFYVIVLQLFTVLAR